MISSANELATTSLVSFIPNSSISKETSTTISKSICVHSAKELYARTGIPRSTIYDNIKRLKVRGNVDHARRNGRPKKISNVASRAIEKQIKKDSSISTRTLAAYLSSIGNDVSYRTIRRHLAIIGYVKNVPQKTPMLINNQKRKRVE
ncbi:18905_t:CDS:2 [Racocetra persica]|uniref:18905_t:CDS:1 n=1 Tax=Racocetra persica TaxID=160502 RepID=A0ACA9KKR1_9GLOM|nr:18905_t:CDS:2 [Racocetra persica]